MDIVVGHDRTPRGDEAVCAAAALAEGERGEVSLGVVVVVTQIDLDRTGELSAEAKRRVAVERAFPETWRRVEEALYAAGRDPEALSMDVIVRVADVHLVRSQARIADELLQVAVDHGASRIVLGRRGRPDGVADNLLARSTREDLPELGDVLVLRVDPERAGVKRSEGFQGGPR